MTPRYRLPFAICLATILLSAPFAAAAPKSADEWIDVPAPFVSTRAVRGLNAQEHTYRCVIGVSPTTGKPGLAHWRILSGSGERALDEVAWEFVRGRIERSPTLIAMLATKELDFKLTMTPPSVSTSSFMKSPPTTPDSTLLAAANYFAPKPPIPLQTRLLRHVGQGTLKIIFSHDHGMPLDVFMERSTNSRLLDASTLQWVAIYWRWLKPGPVDDVKTVNFGYFKR